MCVCVYIYVHYYYYYLSYCQVSDDFIAFPLHGVLLGRPHRTGAIYIPYHLLSLFITYYSYCFRTSWGSSGRPHRSAPEPSGNYFRYKELLQVYIYTLSLCLNT